MIAKLTHRTGELQKRNADVREAKKGVPWWAVAEELGMAENTLLRWMRSEMNEPQKQIVLDAIARVKKESGVR